MSDLLPVIFDSQAVAEMSVPEIREMIADIEKACLEHGESIDVPVKHLFSDNVYAREMSLPKGALIVGKIHKKKNLNILSKGTVSVLSVDGVKKVSAPYTFVASEGAKRVIYAHDDVVWTTVHGTAETDVDKIEDEFIAKSYDEIPSILDIEKIEEVTK